MPGLAASFRSTLPRAPSWKTRDAAHPPWDEPAQGNQQRTLAAPHLAGLQDGPAPAASLNHLRLRRASLRNSPTRRGAREWWGTGVARESRPVGAEGIAGQAQGSRSFSRRGAPPRPLRLACFRVSPPTRRDTRFEPTCPLGRTV